MCHVLPLKANLAQWDLILEPIVQVAEMAKKEKEKSTIINGEQLVLDHLEQLCKQIYHKEGKLIFTPLEHWHLNLPQDSSWSIELIDTPKHLTATTRLGVKILQNNKIIAQRKYWPLRVEHRVVCLCAKHNLVPQIAVDFNDFNLEERNLIDCQRTPFSGNTQSGFKLKRKLNANDILFEDAVERQNLINRGTLVDVVVKKGYLTVNLKGTALTSGNLNETIQIKNLSNNKTFYGKIINANTVQVFI